MMESMPEQTKATALDAFDTLFNKRDDAAAEGFWSDRDMQHSAHIAPGRGGVFALGRALPATLRAFVPGGTGPLGRADRHAQVSS